MLAMEPGRGRGSQRLSHTVNQAERCVDGCPAPQPAQRIGLQAHGLYLGGCPSLDWEE